MAIIFCSGFFSDIVTCLLRVLLGRTDQNSVVGKGTGIKLPVHLQLPLLQIRENQLYQRPSMRTTFFMTMFSGTR